MGLASALLVMVAACGGSDGAQTTLAPGDQDGSQPIGGTQGTAPAGGASQAGEVEPEPAGPVDPNSIRIGSQVWKRTLPMTQGQCFLFKDDGTLPTSASVWGTLDGNEEVRFSAGVSQDGTFHASVTGPGDSTLYWKAGAESPDVDDLVVELDFDSQTIKGSGTFHSLTERRLASGSFEFICEPEG
jgi:hypothetical protein